MASPRYARSESALWHRTSARTLVSPAAGSEVIELTGIAALVWEVLGEPVAVDDLVDDVAAVFGQTAAAVHDDLERLLVGLVDAGAAVHAD